MDLDENSSIEDILDYIENFPYNFLYYYSDKPWAQLYIDEAAKKTAKRNSYSFLLSFSDKPWAQPYIDEAAKGTAKDMPLSFLRNFSDQPWAQSYIDEAAKGTAKENPKYFLEHLADRFPQGIDTALFALGDENESERK